jgi:hypothetical protein
MAASAAVIFSAAGQGKTTQKQFIDGLIAQAKKGNKDSAFRLAVSFTRGYDHLPVDVQKAKEFLKVALTYEKAAGDNISVKMAAEQFCFDNRDIFGEEQELIASKVKAARQVQPGEPDETLLVGIYQGDCVTSKFLNAESSYLGRVPQQIKAKWEADPARKARSEAFTVKDTQECIDAGYTPAKTLLALITCEGKGVERDVSKGIKLLEEAANAGDGTAKIELSCIYYIPKFGVEQDLKEAHKWAKSAQQQGIPGANYVLKRISQMKGCVLL